MKLHRFDPLSFLAGLIATAIGLVFLISEEPADFIEVFDAIGTWFWPVVLIVVGVAILTPLAPWRVHRPDEQDDV